MPPHGAPHPLALTATFPDATVTAVWLQEAEARGSHLGVVQRSTRPPDGAWGDPVPLPVTDVGGLAAVAPRADGGLEIAYTLSTATERPHQVRTWNADGSVSEVSLDDAASSFDLAPGGAGRAVLAWQQRARGEVGAAVHVVRSEGRAGWTKPLLLDRLAAAEHRPLSAPVVAAAGDHGVVAWSGPASIPGLREVSTAWLTDEGADRRSLTVAGHFSGFADLSLEVDLRVDGDLLLTYLQRRGNRRQVMAWVGSVESWPHLTATLLVRDAGVMRADAASLVPGHATVVATTGDGGLVSFTQER